MHPPRQSDGEAEMGEKKLAQSKERLARQFNRSRATQLNIRVSEAEKQQLADDAARAGLPVSVYARQLLFDAPVPRQVRRPSVDTQYLARLLGHIGKIGGNINQLAKKANQGIAPQLDALQAELTALKTLRQEIKQALGRREERQSPD